MNALVFAGNDGVALELGVAIHSAATHLSVDVRGAVLDTGLTDNTRRRLARICPHIEWLTVSSERLDGLPPAGQWTVGTYARLLILDLLPEVERAVYLDADVLVKRDLAPLCGIDLDGASAAAVRDFHRPRSGARPYFNAGVLVLNCERWRSTDLDVRVIACLIVRAAEFRYLDQDGLNAVVSDWSELDWSWNVQQVLRWIEECAHSELTDQSLAQPDTLYRDAAVIHFVGAPKPWYHGWDSPATWLWIQSLLNSRYYKPAEMTRWVGTWLAKRGAKRTLSLLGRRAGEGSR